MSLIQKTASSFLAGMIFSATPTSVDAAPNAETLEDKQGQTFKFPPPPLPPAPPRRSRAKPATPGETDYTPKVSRARAAVPRNQAGWMSKILAAYPSRAKREGIEGTVGVSVTIAPTGRVAECRVVRSSGSDLLDQAACKAAQRYARFEPALDLAGNPTSGSFHIPISYRLEERGAALEKRAPKPPPDEDWQKEVAEMEASLAAQRGGTPEYDDALAWLDAAQPFTLASTRNGSAVIMRGFIDVRTLTDERIAALNEGSIKPNLILTKPEEATREPIQIVHSKLQAGVPAYCALLVQLQRSNDGQDLGDVADAIERAPFVAPAFALNEECGSGAPWEKGVKPGDAFEWDTGPAFVAAGGAVRVDEILSCEGIKDITQGQFTLSPFAIFNTRFFSNVPIEIGRRNSFSIFNPRVFDEATRSFINGATRAEPVEIKHIDLVFDPGVIGDHRDVSATFKILDDDEADEFCTIVRLEQNASVFQRVMRTPRDGRILQWDSRRSGKSWNGDEDLRAFGKAIGSEFRAVVTVESSPEGDPEKTTVPVGEPKASH